VYNEDDKEELPKTLPEAKDEIRKMLLEACKLPEAERKKAIRRLYLRWHPDKHPKSYDLCNEAFKFLKNQVTKIFKG
jgi:sacsin